MTAYPDLVVSLIALNRTAIECGEIGGQGGNRTCDTRIFNPLLYQLSYLAAVGKGGY